MFRGTPNHLNCCYFVHFHVNTHYYIYLLIKNIIAKHLVKCFKIFLVWVQERKINEIVFGFNSAKCFKMFLVWVPQHKINEILSQIVDSGVSSLLLTTELFKSTKWRYPLVVIWKPWVECTMLFSSCIFFFCNQLCDCQHFHMQHKS